ncbi:hypothetical protein N657DRAFT_650086, partial [Parathielavia appendiculata]
MDFYRLAPHEKNPCLKCMRKDLKDSDKNDPNPPESTCRIETGKSLTKCALCVKRGDPGCLPVCFAGDFLAI